MNYNSNQSYGSKLINLRSKDADRSEDTSHLHFHLSDTVIAPDNSVTLISVVNAQIPFVFYSTSNANNNLKVTETINGVSITRNIVLETGNYSEETIEDEIRTKLNSNSNISYTLTYNLVKNKFTFSTSTQNATVIFDFSIEKSCRKQLGFSAGTHTMTSTNPLTSDSVCDMTGDVHSLMIKTNLSSNSVLNSENKAFDLTLAKIPITCDAGNIILYEPINPFQTMVQTRTYNYIELQLTDNNNNNIEMHGVHFEVTLQFDFVSKVDDVSKLTDAISKTLSPEAKAQAQTTLEKTRTFYKTYSEQLYEFHQKFKSNSVISSKKYLNN